MPQQSVMPPARLAPYISRYWYQSNKADHELPVFTPGTGADLFLLLNRPERSFLAFPRHGLLQAPAEEVSSVLVVRFRCGQLQNFTGLAATGMADQFCRLQTIWPNSWRALTQKLQDGADPRAAIAVMNQFLLSQIHYVSPMQQQMQELADELYYSPAMGSAQLAQQHGMSRRTLERHFHCWHGVSPGYFSRLARLQHSIRQLVLEPGASLSHIVFDRGFSDQAHFSHECRKLTGQTPGRIRALYAQNHYYFPASRQPAVFSPEQ